jgi:MFS family permease
VIDRVVSKSLSSLPFFITDDSIVYACANGSNSADKLLWMLMIGRGIADSGVGGEYPCAGTSAIEAADERLHYKKRIEIFTYATDLPISMGVPYPLLIFLLV